MLSGVDLTDCDCVGLRYRFGNSGERVDLIRME